ncbi:MAG: GNAT family N-acetyltransferase [Alphaproteobacteria bacterium]|nr:GNAT family N-acetyltransferase [Alphaproteobacteria bacterium]MBV9694137.1 GNAT family N-acetyltransferase [Alphaproteobacteria bacterium]
MSEAAVIPQPGAICRITAADVAAASDTLARAFLDDPVMMHFLPEDAERTAKLPRIFRLLLKLAMPHALCHITPGHESAAIWRPPGKWHMSLWDYLANGPELLGIFSTNVFNVMATMDRVEKVHPREPHFYLQVLGTDPPHQGKGFAGRVMRHQLAVCDAARMPCYLESSKETNIPVYRSLGFEVSGEIKIPEGPILWPMWRTARK